MKIHRQIFFSRGKESILKLYNAQSPSNSRSLGVTKLKLPLLIPRPIVQEASLSGREVEIGSVKFDIIDIQTDACDTTKEAVQKVLKNDKNNILKKNMERLIPYATSVADLFLDRFRPENTLSDKEYYA